MVAHAGAESVEHCMVRLLLGRPSSVAVPSKLAAAVTETDWSGPADSVGRALRGAAVGGATVTVTVSDEVSSPSVAIILCTEVSAVEIGAVVSVSAASPIVTV